MSDGTFTVGGVTSTYVTVTVKLAVSVFPDESDAVQVTVVGGPTVKNEPEAGEQVGTTTPLTSSVAETSNEILSPELLEAATVMSDGTFTVGGVVSMSGVTIVTVKLAVPSYPGALDAVQVTVVVPAGKPDSNAPS